MKKTFFSSIVVIAMFLCNYTYGQPYKSLFGHTSTEYYLYTTLGPKILTVVADCVINNVHYKYFNYNFLIAEDTNVGKVWITDEENLSSGVPSDTLIYFNKQVGDSLKYSSYLGNSIIDSVYYEYGLKILRTDFYWLNPDYINFHRLKFIESVGSNFGFPHLYLMTGIDYYEIPQVLLCAYKDGVKVFQNTDSIYEGQCIYYGIDNKDIKRETIIYPNPVRSYFDVFLPENGEYELMLFNSMGELINIKRVQNRVCRMPMDQLGNGLYFLQINNNGNKRIYKILKTN